MEAGSFAPIALNKRRPTTSSENMMRETISNKGFLADPKFSSKRT